MKILTELTLFFNIITILFFAFGLFHQFENPKNKAVYGYTIAAGMIPYMLLLSLFILVKTIFFGKFLYLLLFICIASPFIIGKLVKFETLKKYTVIQILCFCISLFFLF